MEETQRYATDPGSALLPEYLIGAVVDQIGRVFPEMNFGIRTDPPGVTELRISRGNRPDPARSSIPWLITQLEQLNTQDSRIAVRKLREAQEWVEKCGIQSAEPPVQPLPRTAEEARAAFRYLGGVEFPADFRPWPENYNGEWNWRRPVESENLGATTNATVDHEAELRSYIYTHAPTTDIGAVDEWAGWVIRQFRARVAIGESPESARSGLEQATRNRFGITTADHLAELGRQAQPDTARTRVSSSIYIDAYGMAHAHGLNSQQAAMLARRAAREFQEMVDTGTPAADARNNALDRTRGVIERYIHPVADFDRYEHAVRTAPVLQAPDPEAIINEVTERIRVERIEREFPNTELARTARRSFNDRHRARPIMGMDLGIGPDQGVHMEIQTYPDYAALAADETTR